MNDKLVKYRSPDAQRIDEALARIRGEIIPSCPGSLAPAQQSAVDLPRFCAVHGKPYGSRYVWMGDRWRYARPIAVTEAMYQSQYAESEKCEVPGDDIGEEKCGLCGATGYGSVLCGSCHREVCYGLTVWNVFRCCCGHEGKMQSTARNHTGIVPRLTGW
ncbi:MAG: hypothetical protein ABSD98_01835 [Candidatus Korobacteraceae bacterium]|jgi:hypothetical protein